MLPSSCTARLRAIVAVVLLATASVFVSAAHAASITLGVVLDTDANPATGCTVATANGPATGIERLVTVGVVTSGAGATVDHVDIAQCGGGSMGTPQSLDGGGWPVGIGNGMGGTSVVELAIPLSVLPPGATMRAFVVADNGAGGTDATGAFTIALRADGPVAPPAIPVPLAPWLVLPLGLLVFVALRWLGPRLPRQMAVVAVCAILAASGIAWAASVMRDGNAGDWAGIAAAIIDPTGDAPDNADLAAAFYQQDATNLYLRIDADIRRDQGGDGNVAPTVHAGANQAITLPATATLAGSASDDGLPSPPSALALTWSVDSGPGAGVLFADAHAAQTVATFVAPGTYVLRLAADDGALSSSSTVTVVVGDTGPQLQAIADRTIAPGDRYLQQLQAQDANVNAVLTFSLIASPAGSALAPPALVDWTPTAAQIGTHTFTAQVRDGAGRTSAATFHVTVARQNRPPVLASQSDAALATGAALTRTLSASDPDGDTLVFDLLAAPPGATLDGDTLAWNTAGLASGRYTIKVRVRDAEGQSDVKSFVVTLRDSVAPVAVDDHYEVQVGTTLAVAAPGLLANDVAAGGASLLARKLTDTAIGTLPAFGADGSFTFVAPQALPPQPSPTPKVLWQASLPDNIGYGLSADIDKDGGADLVTSSFGVPVAFDGKTGARFWTGWDSSQTSLGRDCAQYLFGTDLALGDVDESGDITLIQGTNCDNRYSAGVSTRLIALDTTPSHAVNGQARVKWVSERLDAKIPIPPAPGAPPVDTYMLSAAESGLASYATPTLARLAAGGGVKVLTRMLISGDQFPYDSDGDGSRDTNAGCRGATGKVEDEGKGCKVTFIVDAATGIRETVLAAPNPLNEVETVEREPMRQTAPVVADLDGDGQVEIVSGSDVYKYANGQWTLAWQAAFPAAERFYDPMAVAVADLDGDGNAEVILQSAWDQTGRQHGFLVYRHDGVLLHHFTVPAWDLGLLSIADVDGDGLPEILITARGIAYAYRPDGSLLWATLIPDDDLALFPGDDPDIQHWPTAPGERSATGSVAVYDLDLDGAPEVIVPGRHRLVILDGRTGQVRASAHNNGLSTNHVLAMVVDVDGDGHAEILDAAGNSGSCAGCPATNLLAFHGADSNWAPAPRVFNQLNYNPWTIDDAGAIAYDGAVHRSFRQQRQLGTAVDPRVRDTATFTYAATDGGVESAPATVHVQIVPPNRPPVITSTPPSALLDLPQPPANAYPSFVYQVAAYDPDPGDHVHYELVHSTVDTAYFPQATVDAATGVMRMYTGPCGSYGGPCDFGPMLFIVAAVDSRGARTEQAFTIDVISQTRIVPDVVGQAVGPAKATITGASLTPRVVEVFDAHPAGIVVAQDPSAGTPNVPRSATVTLSVSKGPQPVVMPYVVGQTLAAATQQLTALGLGVNATTSPSTTVAAGMVMAQMPAFGTTIVPSPAHPAALTASSGPPLSGAISKIVIEPGAIARVAGDDIGYHAIAEFDDGTARDITLAATWTSSDMSAATVSGAGAVHAAHAGATSITATLDGTSAASTLTVVAPVAEGTDPLAAITAPVDGASVAGPLVVTGTASDDHFLRYELAYAADGDAAFTLIREGMEPVLGAALGTFDPTVLVNGVYTLRLTVHDRGGNTATATASVTVEGNRKVGAFTLAYTDLTVPLAGIPIQITRTYDSRDKGKGDFGIGWRLGLKAVRVATTRAPGDGWEVVKVGFNYELVSAQSRYVTVTLPNGRVETFDLRITPSTSPLVPFETVRATIAPRPGAQGTLEILSNTDLLILDPQPGKVTLVDDGTLESFQPERFRYTQRDGTQFIVTRAHGVESVKDANGNTLTVTPGGIAHSAGVAITFTRDAEDRITAINDPAGNMLGYGYSDDGDLVRATDRGGNITKYAYDRLHGLVRIEDPLGRVGARTEYDDAGRVVSITDANGNTTQFRHDLDGRQEQVEDALGHLTIRTYDERGNVLAIADPLGHTTTMTYDARDRMLSRSDANGATTHFTYDDHDNLTGITDPLGRTRTAIYDDAGHPLTITDARGHTTRNSYDARGNPATTVDAAGRTTTFAYDAAGNPTSVTAPGGAVSQVAYDGFGRRATLTDPAGRAVSLAYDANGNIAAQSDADGGSATLAYDANGRIVASNNGGLARTLSYDASGVLASVTAASGRAMTLATDGAGRLTDIVDPERGTLAGMTFDAVGNRVASVDGLGNRVDNAYDGARRLTSITTATGTVERRVYDAADHLVQIVNPRGFSTYFAYDAAGQVVAKTDALGGVTRYAYDGNGNTIAETDAAGRVTRFDYDVLDRLTRTTYADGSQVSVEYDEAGNVVRKLDATGAATRYMYDGSGRLTLVTDALGQTLQHAYDGGLGKPARTTDGNGHVTRYTHDAKGRLLSTTYADGSTESTTYDDAGNVLTFTNGNGERNTWHYDAQRRADRLTLADGSTQGFAYTDDGLPATLTDARGTTTFEYDAVSRRLAKVTEPGGRYVRYGYDTGGLRTLVAHGDASGERVLTYVFDALGRMTTMTAPDGSSTHQAFDAAGNLVRIERPNGVVTMFAYDARNRVRTLTHQGSGGTVLLQETYTRDANGNVLRVDRNDGSRIDYAYDALARVVGEQRYASGGARVAQSAFAYDAGGNRTRSGSPGAPKTYVYDVNDRLISGAGVDYAYDAAGRRTRATWTEGGAARVNRYRWNSVDRLIGFDDAAGDSWAYAYDPHGTRQAIAGPEGNLALTSDRTHPGGFAQLLRIGGGSRDDTFDWMDGLTGVREGATGLAPIADALGSTRAMTVAPGVASDMFDYDAFGTLVARTGAADATHRFAGEVFDRESNLVYLRARHYDPRTGTFLSRDPLQGSLDNPLSRNRYLYALANPVNLRDPGGEESLAEVNFASAEALQVQGRAALNARRGLQRAGEVTIDTARVYGGVMAIEAVVDQLAGSPVRVQRWFGTGMIVSGFLDVFSVGLGGSVNSAIAAVATLGMGVTAFDMLGGREVNIIVEGAGVLLAGSIEEAKVQFTAEKSAGNRCVSEPGKALAWAERGANVIELCKNIYSMPWIPDASTLTVDKRASIPGIILHEYTHISLRTRDNAYSCHAEGARGLPTLAGLAPGSALLNADSYRCWAEDAAVGWSGSMRNQGF